MEGKKMSVIKCYNSATGKTETVSAPLPTDRAKELLGCFAGSDTQTDHTYYVAESE